MTTNRATPIRKTSLPRWPHRPSPGRTTGPVPGLDKGVDLVARARAGHQKAWDALVERYAPLVWSICRRHRLDGADAADVSQNVWLHLIDHLGNLRNPAELPRWLATTRRERGRVPRCPRAAVCRVPTGCREPPG
jgi:hypothetical protein